MFQVMRLLTKKLKKMNKELFINAGITFVVVIAAIVIHEKFIRPKMA